MVLTWLAGVQGVTTGCGTVAYLRKGSMPDAAASLEQAKSAPDPVQGVIQYAGTAHMRALAEHAKVVMPLSVAQILLSLLLVAASAMVLAGRPNSRSFALQVLLANAILAIVSYAATREVREAWIQATVQAADELLSDGAPENPLSDLFQMHELAKPRFWYAIEQLKLAFFELGVLAIATLAVASKRTRAFLDAVARAEERFGREDEP